MFSSSLSIMTVTADGLTMQSAALLLMGLQWYICGSISLFGQACLRETWKEKKTFFF